jgi:26S proteasome regulatory subunit N5
VTEGKIYCEVERARLTMRLSRMKEAAGDMVEAARVLQEVQVETYGAMERREKAEFLLDQIRLCLDTGDNVRTELISKKMTAKVLDEELFQDIRVRFYELMIRFHTFRKDHLSIARDFRAIFRTADVQADDARWQPALKRAVVHAVLAPFDKEQQELIALLAAEKKKIGALPAYAKLAACFTTDEIACWPEVRAMFEAVLPADHPGLFGPGDDAGATATDNWLAFQNSVVRHNIRVAAIYYSRIPTARLAELLSLDADATEKHIADMVVGGRLYARIDRPAGTVSFVEPRGPTEILNSWSADVTKLLGLVDRACHIASMEIQNEESRAKLAGKAK